MKSITITFLSLLMTTVVFAQEVKNISYSQDNLGYKILVTYKGGNVQAVPQDSVGLDGIEYPKRLIYNELIEHIVDQNLFKAEEVYRQTALNIIDVTSASSSDVYLTLAPGAIGYSNRINSLRIVIEKLYPQN